MYEFRLCWFCWSSSYSSTLSFLLITLGKSYSSITERFEREFQRLNTRHSSGAILDVREGLCNLKQGHLLRVGVSFSIGTCSLYMILLRTWLTTEEFNNVTQIGKWMMQSMQYKQHLFPQGQIEGSRVWTSARQSTQSDDTRVIGR